MHSSKQDIYIHYHIKAQGTPEKKGQEESKSRGWGRVLPSELPGAMILHPTFTQNGTSTRQTAVTGLSELKKKSE